MRTSSSNFVCSFRSVCARFLAITVFVAGSPAAAAPVELQLRSGHFDPLALTPPGPASAEPPSGYFIVQFQSPIAPALIERIRGAGAKPIAYLPEQAYVVHLPSGGAATLRALPEVRWVGPFRPEWKLAPDLGTRPYAQFTRPLDGRLEVTVDLFAGEELEPMTTRASELGLEILSAYGFSDTRRLRLRGTMPQLQTLAQEQAVAWIEEVAEISERNNAARWVVQTDVPDSFTVWDRGLHGEGQVIGHIDSRIDMNSCFFRDPVNNTPGPGHRKVIAYRSNAGLGASSHGTHTAGTSAGDQFPINGTLSSNGHAYAAKLSHSNLNDISGSGSATSNLYTYLSAAHNDGARVHTNSWGDDGTTAYTTWTRDIDLFSYNFEDSLVLFAVSNLSTLRTPENAKNVLAVGASQNGLSNDNFCSGGTGPTNDGRRKPEIYAPGCGIVSARSGFTCSTTSSTGTSMACPAVTATGALVAQYFREGWYPSGTLQPADAYTPSGALIKAMLLNSAVDMTGIAGYPSNQEGWGRVLLENALYFQGDTRGLAVLADQRNATGLNTGGTIFYPLEVSGSSEPLEVTLTFTEPAAALFASPATVNNLNLVVTSPSGATYLGNVLSSGVSIEGGSPDNINNVEQVILPSPETGEWLVTVNAASVNQGPQGFALVATGQVALGGGVLVRYDGHVVQDVAPLGNSDARIDPGETLTLPVTVRNLLSQPVTGVTGRLTTPTPELAQISRALAAFPDLAGNSTGASLAPHFELTISPTVACGTVLEFDLILEHDEGTIVESFTLEVGRALAEFAAGGTPTVVPAAGTVVSTTSVDEVLPIGDVNVAVNILHQNISELSITLSSPQGTQVVLHDYSGVGANLNAVYDQTRPVDGPGSMSDFDGQSALGNWSLVIKDGIEGAAPAGTLQSWSLRIQPAGGPQCATIDCGGEPVPPPLGPTLRVDRDGPSDLRLDWQSVGGATTYRIWQALSPDFTNQELVTATGGVSALLAGAAGGADLVFYQVRPANSCNWEGQ